MMGASNTVGMGSSLSYEDRLKLHLRKNPIKGITKSSGGRVFLSFDYFFPTNFSALNQENEDPSQRAREMVSKWSQDYREVFLVKLPHYSDRMPERVRTYFDKLDEHAPVKNVLEALNTPKMSPRVIDLNRTLEDLDQQYPNVHVLSFSPFYDYLDGYLKNRRKQARHGKRAGRNFYYSYRSFFKDPLHINDLGQAHFFNLIFRPALNEILGIQIDPMKLETLKKAEVKTYIRERLCPLSTFMNEDKCHYWVDLKDKKQFELKNAIVHIPERLSSTAEKQVISADSERQIWREIEQMGDNEGRQATLDIMAIAELIDRNGPHNESGLMIKVVNNKKKLYLDLSKVLFFTTFPTFKKEESVYENWGYDHWLSYKYLYNALQYSGMYSDKGQFERMQAPAPGTNYKITVKVNREKKTFDLIWRVYATVPGQSDDQSRLEYIPEPHFSELVRKEENYPYIEYKLEFELLEP